MNMPGHHLVPTREVRCGSCGALNRVPEYSVARIPSCGRCRAALPESRITKAFRHLYRFRFLGGTAILALLILLSLWAPWTPATKSHLEFAETCSGRSQPSQGLYRSYYYSSNALAPLTIRTATGSNYFVKLEDATTGMPVMSFFIYGGTTLNAEVPLGSFVLKYATGKSWCSDDNLFGQDTTTNKAAYVFTFKQEFTVDGYTLSHHTVELIQQKQGNLRTHTIPRNQF
jgi:hypothetical protein